ncbi:MAG: EamA family transporter [Actinomycetota bacterium]
MIYGLVAALGWGLADFGGAVVGRRIGSITTVVVSQGFNALFMTVLILVGRHDLTVLWPYIGFVALNGAASATAYVTHYRALQLGPVAIVSPIGATYAVVGVGLAIVVLGERPAGIAIAGGVVTVIGVMLASTDLRKVEEGLLKQRPPGLPWAIVSAVMFGIGGFLLGYLSQRVGWVVGLWASRIAQLVAFSAYAALRRSEIAGIGMNRMTAAALGVGLADLLGVIAFSSGAESGFVSIVLTASAVFPLIAVVLSIVLLHERPVPNQYAGIALVIGGLLMLGLGA